MQCRGTNSRWRAWLALHLSTETETIFSYQPRHNNNDAFDVAVITVAVHRLKTCRNERSDVVR